MKKCIVKKQLQRSGQISLCILLLAACDPAELVNDTLKRTAHTVVFPVVNIDMPAEPARKATKCILDAASENELRLLARDVGVEAGTATKATIREIALRPAAQSCFAANGVPPLVGG
ncbi:hypothetical protein [Rhodobacter sp. SY28-1]|uniref:hypothetical protein n=1 Tax=Rhodobacter sp. SY28-1 TaxID=2562317 RepID=UPI0010BF7A90|nr:hypothetical protein [Rhodobacter sp. SY28-1]